MRTKKIQTIFAAVMMIIFYAASSNARIVNVNAGNNFFAPQTISVVVGDTVQWTRTAGSHTTTSDGSEFTSRPSGADPWNSPLTSSNPTFRYVIRVAGLYNYKCEPHEDEMRGVINAAVSSITQLNELVNSYQLSQNFPNPFNPSTKIKFSVPNSTNVSLKIFNNTGQEIAELINEKLNNGSYEINWDASGFTSGVYFYKIQSNDFTETKKMFLVK